MTVGSLKEEIEYLESIKEINDNTEIRMAQQPQWAFEYSLGDSLVVATVKDEYSEASNKVVYLEEGSQLGYLPENVAEEIGW